MQTSHYIYSFIYDYTESGLSKLESWYLFGKEDNNKQLFSEIEVEPSHSAFIKKRLDVALSSKEYPALIEAIKKENLRIDGFKVEYLVFEGDTTAYDERLKKLTDIGYSIEGEPDYYKPLVTYALCYFEGTWCFGLVHKNNYKWKEHKKKPFSFSNSIHVNIAKALINIAAGTNKEAKLLDACCGVGTILLEACFAGKNIEGNDINWKVCRQARLNLAHFNYKARVYRSDVKDMENNYDAAIIDLPYNLFSSADKTTFLHIISSAAQVAKRLVIVSTTDIKEIIRSTGLTLLNSCSVGKRVSPKFNRMVWVCER